MSARLVVNVGLLVGLYYVLPGPGPEAATVRWLRIVLALLLLAVLVRLVVREVLNEARAPSADVHLDRLLLAVVGGVVAFAYADLLLAGWVEGQFVGLETKTDALYFALATLSTVGYGDVHPTGQLARGLVSAQLLFNLVVIATAARVAARELAVRRRSRPHDAG